MILRCKDEEKVVVLNLRKVDDQCVNVIATGPGNIKSCIAIITPAGIMLPENIAPEHGFALDFSGALETHNE